MPCIKAESAISSTALEIKMKIFSMPSAQDIQKYIEKYRNKATVVRQIHSNIAESKRKWDIRHTLATIVLGAIITFTGFMGADRIFDTLFSNDLPYKTEGTFPAYFTQSQDNIHEVNGERKEHLTIIKNSSNYRKKIFDLVFNGAVLMLFITSVLNLIYRWKEDHTVHFQGVVRLTTYINWLDELKLVGVATADINLLKKIRGRYQAIIEALPPNDERDFLKAKRSLFEKEKSSSPSKNSTPIAIAASDETDIVKDFIRKSPLLMLVLHALKNTQENELWLAGGAIRNHVWDQLTGRVTPHDDFDVVYFSTKNLEPIADQKIQQQISAALPSILKISVKNQARMHLLNGEPMTNSFEEAIAQWPETATAIAVRLINDGDLEIFAPYGVTDLQNMEVRPTPYHNTFPTSYNTRTTTKGWSTSWPELTIHPATDHQDA